jgi:hypothetical protein
MAMRCKDIERLMIDGRDRTLDRTEVRAIEQHLTQCASCARFQEDLHKIQNGLRAFSCPAPSDEMIQKTKSLCYAEMGAAQTSRSVISQRGQLRSVPKIIWAAVFVLTVLTGILIISLLPGFEIEEPVSLKTILIITLVVQNAAMLFFAPVLIQKFRFPKNGLDLNGYENLVP